MSFYQIRLLGALFLLIYISMMFLYLLKFKAIKFSGTSEKGVHAEGGFYGKDAEEVAGTYKGKDAMGVFGARKIRNFLSI